jgi:pyruvate/2-oxoglutarate dehydrogenase complex dihydrolipoamide acyltransferase (E2) component
MMPPAPTPSAPGFPIEASKDGTISEDISEDGSYVEVVSSEVLVEAKADAASTAVVTDPGPSQATNMLDTKGALRAPAGARRGASAPATPAPPEAPTPAPASSCPQKNSHRCAMCWAR